MDEQKKICKSCKEEKSIDNFYRYEFPNGTHCYRGLCKTCVGIDAKEKALKNKELGKIASEATCCSCGILKPASEFSKSMYSTTGLTHACCVCLKKRRDEKNKKLEGIEKIIPPTKVCLTCGTEKPISDFMKKKANKDGHTFECKSCSRERRENHIKKLKDAGFVANSKVCTSCKIEKSAKDFYRDIKRNDGLSCSCIECDRIAYKNCDYKDSEEFKERARNRVKEWNKENKHYVAEYAINRYRTNPLHKITVSLRNRLRDVLKGKTKASKTLIMLGTPIRQFKQYFYDNFSDGMTWELFLKGYIHIDHIIPCIHFNLLDKDEQLLCFNYRNMQPLWEKDNYSKHDNLFWPHNIKVPWGDHTKSLEERKEALRQAIFGMPINQLNFPDELSPSVQAFYAM